MSRRRLDTELVRRGLAPSRTAAQDHIASGDVLVAGVCADKPGRLVAPGEPIVVKAPPPAFVSRAGGKLDAAIDLFSIDVQGLRAIDVGASTGGFTDCLLQRGAAHVVALDVGHGQLHERLRNDPRVTVIERCNVRHLAPSSCEPHELRALVGPAASIVVVDVSFISLCAISEALAALMTDDGLLVALIKPQFEAGRREVNRGSGVITDPGVWAEVLTTVVAHFADEGLTLRNLMVSPVQGTRGNVEFVALLHSHGDDETPGDSRALIDAVLVEAGEMQSAGAS